MNTAVQGDEGLSSLVTDLQWFVDQIPAPVSVISVNGRQLFGNAAYRALFGLGDGDLSGFFVTSLRGPQQRKRDRQRKELLDGVTQEIVVDETFLRADGTAFPGRLVERAFRDEGGRAIALIGVIIDTTDEVLAERAQEAAQAKLSGVLDAQRELVCEWRPIDGVITFANQAYRDFFGYGPEVIGRSMLELIPPEDVGTQLVVNAQILKELGEYTATRTYGDGRTVVWSDAVFRHPFSDTVVVVSVGRDETRTTALNERVQASERRTRLLLNNLAGALSLVDAEGRVIERIGRDAKLLATGDGALEPDTFDVRTHPDDQRTLDEILQAVKASPGAVASGELRLRRRDGRYDVSEVTAVNRLDDPYLKGIVVTSRDITAQKVVEAELAARRDEALEQNRRHQAFLAMASHELRNPLQGMVAITELLCESALPPGLAPLTEALQMQTRGMRRTVDDLLEFSSLAAGGLRLQPTVVDVRNVVANVVETIRSTNRHTGLVVESSVSDGVPRRMSFDADRLGQILTNLVGNAAKFAKGGHVHVDLSTDAGGTVLHLEVSDDGPGITPSDQRRVFEPFVQVGDRTITGGAGLGLTIVRLLATSMGGSVGLRSELGAGATFLVDLPIDEIGPGQVANVSMAGPVGKAHVLVVEDDPTNQMVARLQLERLGATAEVVENAEQALAALRDAEFSLVLMDYLLPGMDGMELTKLIRASEANEPWRGRIPIVALTGSVGVATREACLAAGMDDVLTKPAPLADLRSMLETWGQPSPTPVVAGTPPSWGGRRLDFDSNRLELLVAELGDEQSVVTLVRGFLDQIEKREHQLVDAQLAGDDKTLRRVAHDLRSVSQLIGLDRLATVSEGIERGAPSKDSESLRLRLKPVCDDARAILRAWLAKRM